MPFHGLFRQYAAHSVPLPAQKPTGFVDVIWFLPVGFDSGIMGACGIGRSSVGAGDPYAGKRCQVFIRVSV
jgi:hypothetical protein